jgi:hypothetical protein
MDIKTNFSTDIAKRIFRNSRNALNFLIELTKEKSFDLPTNTPDIWSCIVDNWEYASGLRIIRALFKTTEKYKSGTESFATMNLLLEEWAGLGLGDVAWPFSQGKFDEFVQRINSEQTTGHQKDEKVRIAAQKYRRIKEINTVRNDFIETLIFEKNDNILPTLNHSRSVDFFIDGRSFDQKVAKSPTSEFRRDYGENWREFAIEHPEKVAEYLYKYQDEGRFGADNRLLVVYLDENVSIETIAKIIEETDLHQPTEITFDYEHANVGSKTYKVNCFIILLYNLS